MNPYDEIPYPRLSHSQCHPDTLATAATLLGLQLAPVQKCRVLELGCAGGGNLIPMAWGLPESEFVGVDLSAHHIAEGQTCAEALGLTNITFRHLDVREAPHAGLGQFDYVIAHGLYSWIPPVVRDALLETCQRVLAPQGVAYVSYNVYPGWNMLRALREMMRYHVRHIEEPALRAAQARALVDFLVRSVPDNTQGPYGGMVQAYSHFIKEEYGRLGDQQDALLLHDELEDVNDPVYFHEFVAHAARYGLQYLTEAELRLVMVNQLPTHVSEAILQMAKDVVELEQYMDFVRNRKFRQTLLCHADIPLTRRFNPERVIGLCAASGAQPVSPQPNVHSISVEKFRGSDGAQFATDHPVTKAALLHLAELWPQAVPFDDLLQAARRRLNQSEPNALDAQVLSLNLLKAHTYSKNLVELRTYAPAFASAVSDRPVASPWARLQAQDSATVTNLRHERVELNVLTRYILRLLDGSRDSAAVLESLLSGPAASGDLLVQENQTPIQDPERVRQVLAEEAATSLRWLARAALLVS